MSWRGGRWEARQSSWIVLQDSEEYCGSSGRPEGQGRILLHTSRWDPTDAGSISRSRHTSFHHVSEKSTSAMFFLLLKSLTGRLCGLRHVPPHVYSWYGSWSQDLCLFSAQNIGMVKPWKSEKERECQTVLKRIYQRCISVCCRCLFWFSLRDTKAKSLNCQSLSQDILKVLRFCLKMHKKRKRQVFTF